MVGRVRRKGFALPVVITMSIVLLTFVSILFFNARSQSASKNIIVDRARAVAAAQGMMQLAVYKFRLLRSDFYLQETASESRKPFYREAWIADFNASSATSPARIIKDMLGCQDVGVSTYTRLILTKPGFEYKRDILRIVTYGVCNSQRESLEQMIEVKAQN